GPPNRRIVVIVVKNTTVARRKLSDNVGASTWSPIRQLEPTASGFGDRTESAVGVVGERCAQPMWIDDCLRHIGVIITWAETGSVAWLEISLSRRPAGPNKP